MFNLGDRVKHKDTDDSGIVVGYGHRIINNKCLKTIKVRITSLTSSKKTTVKDLDSNWLPARQENYQSQHRDPLAHHFIVKPVKKYNLANSAHL